jgi:hypothetical protein
LSLAGWWRTGPPVLAVGKKDTRREPVGGTRSTTNERAKTLTKMAEEFERRGDTLESAARYGFIGPTI